jgi:hypothetical protein
LLIQVLPIGEGVCHKKDKNDKARPACFYRELLEVNAIEIGGKHYRIKNRTKKEVNFYSGYGWLSQEELFNLRQVDVRQAP